MTANITMQSIAEEATDNRERRLHQKWGDAVSNDPLTGFVIVPEVLLRGQKDLGIRATELVVLMNILMHWWEADRKPFPSNEAIAHRMGVKVRTVQRAMRTLQQQGLINREITRFHDEATGTHSSRRDIDLAGVVRKSTEIANKLRLWNEHNDSGLLNEPRP